MVVKKIVCRTRGPGFIWMSPASSIHIVRKVLRDLAVYADCGEVGRLSLC